VKNVNINRNLFLNYQDYWMLAYLIHNLHHRNLLIHLEKVLLKEKINSLPILSIQPPLTNKRVNLVSLTLLFLAIEFIYKCKYNCFFLKKYNVIFVGIYFLNNKYNKLVTFVNIFRIIIFINSFIQLAIQVYLLIQH